MVVKTYTSTSSGRVVTVTSTSYVDADPAVTSSPGDGRPNPSLQNAAPRQEDRGMALFALIGAVMGLVGLI